MTTPEATVPESTELLRAHYDTVCALRRWGHARLADDMLTVLLERAVLHEATLDHYQGLLDEWRAQVAS